MPMVATPLEPLATVICATTTLSDGASSGFMKNTAPSVEVSADCSVQLAKSIPMALRATSDLAALPSVNPMVSQESNSELSPPTTFHTDGLVPPTFTPNGAAAWKAAGICIGESAEPKIAYRLLAPPDSDTANR